MNFVSYHQLQHDLMSFASGLPPLRGIIGVPRSGSMVAYMLGLHLHLPTADIDTYLAGEGFPKAGRRLRQENLPPSWPVLLLDDSACSGRSMKTAASRLMSVMSREDYISGVVYHHPKCPSGIIDLFHRTIPGRRAFEWNIWNKPKLMKRTLVDFDGVLCFDPPREKYEDKYVNFITRAPPLYRPRVVKGIVTCRLEKRREISEAWLRAQGIRYGSLTMMQYDDWRARQRHGRHGGWKAEVYRASRATLFIESDRKQADVIFKIAQRPVLCTSTMRMLLA